MRVKSPECVHLLQPILGKHQLISSNHTLNFTLNFSCQVYLTFFYSWRLDIYRIIHGARRYGISLRLFNSIDHEWDVELNTRREIPYLQATMYYFVYHINTIALYWEEKPTSFMNEYKWIDNPWMTIVDCVGGNS